MYSFWAVQEGEYNELRQFETVGSIRDQKAAAKAAKEAADKKIHDDLVETRKLKYVSYLFTFSVVYTLLLSPTTWQR